MPYPPTIAIPLASGMSSRVMMLYSRLTSAPRPKQSSFISLMGRSYWYHLSGYGSFVSSFIDVIFGVLEKKI